MWVSSDWVVHGDHALMEYSHELLLSFAIDRHTYKAPIVSCSSSSSRSTVPFPSSSSSSSQQQHVGATAAGWSLSAEHLFAQIEVHVAEHGQAPVLLVADVAAALLVFFCGHFGAWRDAVTDTDTGSTSISYQVGRDGIDYSDVHYMRGLGRLEMTPPGSHSYASFGDHRPIMKRLSSPSNRW